MSARTADSPTTILGVAPEERRAYLRHRIGTRALVTDPMTGRLLGAVHDLSIGGLSIEADGPVVVGLKYALAVEFRVRGEARPNVSLNARCVWRRFDEALGRDRAGFEFLPLSPQARERLLAVIAEL